MKKTKIKKYDPWYGVNFLPDTEKWRKLLHGISSLFIVLSTAMLFYPLGGRLAFPAVNKSFPFWRSFTPCQKDCISLLGNAAVKGRVFQKVRDKKPELAKQGTKQTIAQLSTVQNSSVSYSTYQETQSPKPISPQKKNLNNKIIIPKINVEMVIEGGNDQKVLNKGSAWWIPGTSNPSFGGNFVLGGHRWAFRPPQKKTFYHLDKLERGDIISILWDAKEYTYKVYNTMVVKPQAVEILAPTSKTKLTLFTCTPLFSSKERLVIEAEPI